MRFFNFLFAKWGMVVRRYIRSYNPKRTKVIFYDRVHEIAYVRTYEVDPPERLYLIESIDKKVRVIKVIPRGIKLLKSLRIRKVQSTMSMFTMPSKDPTEVLDYTLDFTSEFFQKLANLENDEILTATWTIPQGLNQVSSIFDASTATVFLSGGTHGQRYTVALVVTTKGNRTYRATFDLKVENK